MKKSAKLLSCVLVLLVVFCSIPISSISSKATISSSITTSDIQAVLDKYNYVTGRYWTYPSGGSATNGYMSSTRAGRSYSYRYNGIECYGFANFVMHKVTSTTVYPGNGNTDDWTKLTPSRVSQLLVGDIVRIGKSDSNGHSGIVLTNNGGKCTFAQCLGGVDNKITIGNALAGTASLNNNYKNYSALSSMKNDNALVYVYRYKGNIPRAEITVSKSSVTLGLIKNKAQTVTGQITGSYAHWQNDWDGSIIGVERTVSNGKFEWKITARSAGTTNLVLKAQDKNYNTLAEKKIKITVSDDTPKITVSKETVSLGLLKNNTQTITGKLTGSYSHWQNDWDGSIIGVERTVNNGEFTWNITARSVGSTNLVLKAQDDNYNTLAEKRIKITVVDDTPKITVSTDSVSLGLTSNRTQTVTGKLTGSYAHWQNDWDGSVFGVERTETNGEFVWIITARSTGTSDLVLIAQDENYNSIVEKRIKVTVSANNTDNATFYYDAAGGDFDVSSSNVNFGDTIEIPNSIPTRSGYQFVGWNAKRNDDDTWATEGDGWLSDSELSSQEVDKQLFVAGTSYGFDSSWINGLSSISSYTFYAVWKANTYTVDYNSNGGTSAPDSQTKTHGEDLKLSTEIPQKMFTITYDTVGGIISESNKELNCTFTNWKCNYDNEVYNPGTKYSIDSNATLAAQWENPTAGILATPTKDDCSFIGWFTEEDGGTEIVETTVIMEDTTVYAHWLNTAIIDSPYKLIIESKAAVITDTEDTISISLTLEDLPDIKTFAISDIQYNKDKLELTEFNWATDGIIKSWNGSRGALAKEVDTDMNGEIIDLVFKVKDGCTQYAGDYTISCNFTARQADSTTIQVAVIPGVISINNVLLGDLDGNDIVNEDDSIYLLYSTFFEEDYPLNQDCDFDNNGKVDEDDAIYLLYYTFFPEDYPLNNN